MKFFEYEKPEGHSKGQTEVLVNRHVIERAGGELPQVNYDSLTQLMKVELGLGNITVRQYMGSALGHVGSPLNKWAKGFHIPLSNSLYSSAWESGRHLTGGATLNPTHTTQMEKLLYAAVGLSEARNSRRMLTTQRAKLLGLPAAFTTSVALGVEKITSNPDQGAVAGAIAGIPLLISINRYLNEKDNRRTEKIEELLAVHGRDIVYPHSVN